MGVGSAKGVNKAEDAANAAISSPLLETSISGARGVIINITSSPDIGLDDVEKAATLITNSAHPDANIIWGAAFDESLKDEMCITVIATGFDAGHQMAATVDNAAYPAGNFAFNNEPAPVMSTVQPVATVPTASAGQAAAPVEEQPVEDDADNYMTDIDDILTMLNNRK